MQLRLGLVSGALYTITNNQEYGVCYIETKCQCFCRNQNCRKVFNSRTQRLRHEKQCPNPKKEITETFRKVSNNANECKKCSKQITPRNSL